MAAPTPQAQADKELREKYDASPGADKIREICRNDFRYFYLNILDVRKRGLGRIHDFYIDFKRLHELDQLPLEVCHSPVREYLPERDADGNFRERWLYFPTLASKPEIQDGPEGHLKEMFTSPDLWRGMLIRIAGKGTHKCDLMPRGHLKTELGVVSWPLWEIIRDPSLRTLIRCETSELASARVLQVESHIDDNERFQKYFGNLIPTGKDKKIWNSTQMNVLCKNRRGREPTLTASGITSSRVGFHYDRIILDDVVGESNSDTPELLAKTRLAVQRMAPLGDPGHHFTDVGTKWNDDDAHNMFTADAYDQYKTSSFIVATVRDAEDKLIWPEYTEGQLSLMRASLSGDFEYFCQFYNQPIAGALEKFDKQWIQWYNRHGDENPVLLVTREKLDILMAVDPASTTEKKSDFSACCVMGQSQDGTQRYLLDGFREKISPEELPKAIVDMICKWQDIAVEAKVSFKFGVEEFSFQIFLKKAVTDELRSRGRAVSPVLLKPCKRRKTDRIKVLMTPFQAGRYHIPTTLMRTPAMGNEKSYNLITQFLGEYERFPTGKAKDDFLDSMAYAEEMMRPGPPPEFPEEERRKLDKDRYFRDMPDDMDDPEADSRMKRLFGGGPMLRVTTNNYTRRKKIGSDGVVFERDRDCGRYPRSRFKW